MGQKKQVGAITDYQCDDSFDQMSFHSVGASDQRTEVFATIRIEAYPDKQTNLYGKVDTGSQGNILPMRTYSAIYPSRVKNGMPIGLQRSSTMLTAYNGTTITQYGTLNLQCGYHGKWTSAKFYVTDTEGPIIFGLSLAVEIGLVKLNCLINAEPQCSSPHTLLEKQYPDCFQGLGRMPGQARLTVQPDAQPVIHPPRRAPIQLRDKIKQELERMVKLDVITPVSEPTDWVSSITYVTKRDGSLRICLDPADLNRALKRGQHHIPTTEELTHKLSGATIFSKLDAKCGYWSVQLHPESQPLTTFNTPFGRYCFQRLPFGLNVSQDIFQSMMDVALEGLSGVISIADDICVFGKNEDDHDRNLHALMKRAQERNMVFNPNKLNVKCLEIQFFGHIYDKDGIRPDAAKVQAINSDRVTVFTWNDNLPVSVHSQAK